MAVSVMTKIDALGKECARKPVSMQPKLFEVSFPVARDRTNNGAVVITVKRSTSAKAPTMTRVEFFVRGFRHNATRRTVFPSIANSTTTTDVKDSTTTRLRLLEARDILKQIDLKASRSKPRFFLSVTLSDRCDY